MGFKETMLWKHTLGSNRHSHKSERENLRYAYQGFRKKAATLAAEIHKDLPDLTVHDVTHIDALWTTASLLTGYDSDPKTPTVDFNPGEAFVLGGAFLLHDLGNALAAYPDREKVVSGKEWEDLLHFYYSKAANRRPTETELREPDASIRNAALMQRLRQLHAEHAATLATAPFTSPNNPDGRLYLIEDSELRNSYGPFIGTVAASHWWHVSEVANRFRNPIPPTEECPWLVDLLKVASTLRLADASQIDKTRAPSLLMMVRELGEDSRKHWEFQEKLLGPALQDDRLFYRSRSPFTVHDREAWWECFNALRMIDRELRDVDALLADIRAKWRFAARGVLYSDDAVRLAKESVVVTGWSPIEVNIHVSEPSEVASRLGGFRLYGDDPFIPLRELLANGIDAVRARRVMCDDFYPTVDTKSGRVVITIARSNGSIWLEVQDNGIGMTPQTMAGPLLDFGASYWQSSAALRDNPGLLSSSFRPTGKFGLGFFSVFMLGAEIQVISRHYRAEEKEVHVLAINGRDSRFFMRPTLRGCNEEQLEEVGTRVRVKLARDVKEFRDGLRRSIADQFQSRLTFVERDQRRTAFTKIAAEVTAKTIRSDGQHVATGLPDEASITHAIEREWARVEDDYADLALLEFVLKHHCVSTDVDICVSTESEFRTVVAADDWQRLSNEGFAVRLEGRREGDAADLHCVEPSSLLGDAAHPVGRLFPQLDFAPDGSGGKWFGSVSAGGFRCPNMQTSFCGTLLAEPTEISRREAAPIARVEDIGCWLEANERALVSTTQDSNARLATLMLRCGAQPRYLNPFFRTEFWERRSALFDERNEFRIALCVPPYRFAEMSDVLYAPCGRVPFVTFPDGTDWLETILAPMNMNLGGPLAEYALVLASEWWGLSVTEVIDNLEICHEWQEVGSYQDHYDASPDETFFSKVIIVRRPGVRRSSKGLSIRSINPPSEEEVHPQYRDRAPSLWVSPFFYVPE